MIRAGMFRWLVSSVILCVLAASGGVCHAGRLSAVDSGEGRVLLREPSSPPTLDGSKEDGLPGGAVERNPFRWPGDGVAASVQTPGGPPVSAAELFGTLTLSGILYDRLLPLAVIDDTLLQEGDSINGATVRTILPDQVVLEKGERFHTLHFSELFELTGDSKAHQ